MVKRNPRPFRIYGEVELQTVAQQVSNQLAGWANEWMVSSNLVPEIVATPLPAVWEAGTCWEFSGLQASPFVAVGYDRMFPQQLLDFLLGSGIASQESSASIRMVDILALKVVRALMERLIVSARLTDVANIINWSGAPPQDVDQPGTPFLAFRCTLARDIALYILLMPKLIDAWLVDLATNTREPLTPIVHAFDNQQVTLEVIVGEGELTIEELGTLATGDVIPLDQLLSQEISLRLDAHTAVCGGFLGGVHGQMAVQVAAKR